MKEEGLDGIDLVGCWFSRRIQPLQFRGERLLCQATGERDDPLQVSKDNLAPTVLESRLRKMIKISLWSRGVTIHKDIFLNDTCLKVIPD